MFSSQLSPRLSGFVTFSLLLLSQSLSFHLFSHSLSLLVTKRTVLLYFILSPSFHFLYSFLFYSILPSFTLIGLTSNDVNFLSLFLGLLFRSQKVYYDFSLQGYEEEKLNSRTYQTVISRIQMEETAASVIEPTSSSASANVTAASTSRDDEHEQ